METKSSASVLPVNYFVESVVLVAISIRDYSRFRRICPACGDHFGIMRVQLDSSNGMPNLACRQENCPMNGVGVSWQSMNTFLSASSEMWRYTYQEKFMLKHIERMYAILDNLLASENRLFVPEDIGIIPIVLDLFRYALIHELTIDRVRIAHSSEYRCAYCQSEIEYSGNSYRCKDKNCISRKNTRNAMFGLDMRRVMMVKPVKECLGSNLKIIALIKIYMKLAERSLYILDKQFYSRGNLYQKFIDSRVASEKDL